jgi:hypothetical protein
VVFSRQVDGKTLTFGVSGMLWRNSLIMFDRETQSLWSHITGECLDGKLKGKRLQRLAAVPKVTWREWKRQHPHSQVLSVAGREEGFNRYASYDSSPAEIGISSDKLKDTRLKAKELVIGVKVGGAAKAYPPKAFARRSVLVDQVGDQSLIIFYDKNSEASAVYAAEVEGKVLTFPADAQGVEVADSATGTTWNLLTGKAVRGSLQDKELKRVPHFYGFWFAWVDFNPQTEIDS